MKSSIRALASCVLALLAAADAHAGVYRWVDQNGQVRYSDVPPADQAVQPLEIRLGGMPVALEKRLRGMDPSFSVKRITGDLNRAWVCLDIDPDAHDEPEFVLAFQGSGLGSIRRSAMYAPHACPEAATDRAQRWDIYEIQFDAKAMHMYRRG